MQDFEGAGILCRIPRWWKGAARRAAVTLSLGTRKPSRVGADALLGFEAGIDLDGEQISQAEARRILERAEGMVLIKGRWVPVDTESLRKALDTLKEAQAIKKPGTKQTRAVKALNAARRCVLTGTPVENRLTDLWSLFDFINPGLLGSFKEFKSFAKTLERNPEGFGRLRRVVHPFILRRSKTDKSIISDLPGKVEMKSWCGLSKQQTLLYGNVVDAFERRLDEVEGIERKGLVLATLMRCKQICNHPSHYAGDGDFRGEISGKFQRLAQVCEAIHDKRERC